MQIRRNSPRSELLSVASHLAFWALYECKGRIPGLFKKYLRIDHLDREATLRAIEDPPQLKRPDLRVNFLVSIREDALACRSWGKMCWVKQGASSSEQRTAPAS
jgi:hypothetical protein